MMSCTIKKNPVLLLLALSLPALAYGAIVELSPKEFYDGVMEGKYDAVLDVRRQEEWDAGHIVNATFIPSLQLETAVPADLVGCGNACKTIVVYCKSGKRSAAAIELLLEQGFEGTIYNGMGVNQWTDAGYDLVNTDSFAPTGCSANTSVTGMECTMDVKPDTASLSNDDSSTATTVGAAGIASVLVTASILSSVLMSTNLA